MEMHGVFLLEKVRIKQRLNQIYSFPSESGSGVNTKHGWMPPTSWKMVKFTVQKGESEEGKNGDSITHKQGELKSDRSD